jgi:hypothetical protein
MEIGGHPQKGLGARIFHHAEGSGQASRNVLGTAFGIQTLPPVFGQGGQRIRAGWFGPDGGSESCPGLLGLRIVIWFAGPCRSPAGTPAAPPGSGHGPGRPSAPPERPEDAAGRPASGKGWSAGAGRWDDGGMADGACGGPTRPGLPGSPLQAAGGGRTTGRMDGAGRQVRSIGGPVDRGAGRPGRSDGLWAAKIKAPGRGNASGAAWSPFGWPSVRRTVHSPDRPSAGPSIRRTVHSIGSPAPGPPLP